MLDPPFQVAVRPSSQCVTRPRSSRGLARPRAATSREAGGRAQARGVLRRLGQRLDATFLDQVAHVALETADELLALLLREVGEVARARPRRRA